MPPINNNNLDRGLNSRHGDVAAVQGEGLRSNPSNPPQRGRVGPAEEAAPAYSSIIGASTNGASGNNLKNRPGKRGGRATRQNNDQFDSDNDANDHESEFASEEDGEFR